MTTTAGRIMITGVIMTSTLMAGCTVDSGSAADSARADSAAAIASSTESVGVNVDANGTPPASPDSSPVNSSASSPASPRAGRTIDAGYSGVPPLTIGMSEAEARKALGLPASSSAPAEECRYLDTKGRSRVYAMLIRDTVVRLDVRDSTIATPAGARIGDTESRVLELYRGQVSTKPHKYVSGGHYLIVKSPSDTTRQLVFETDGKRVTSYRVGRTPEVQWVEGCS